MQLVFPEKLSRCQWLPAVSEAVVKQPCVRLPLATATTAVIIVLAVFNLVRMYSQRGHYMYIYMYMRVCVCALCYFWPCDTS